MVAVDGRPALGRSHPLTVEGDDVGAFELNFACGEPGRDYIVTYSERRRSGVNGTSPASLSRGGNLAGGTPGPARCRGFAATRQIHRPRLDRQRARVGGDAEGLCRSGNRSLMVETASDDAVTAIRIGNAGIGRILPTLAAGCAGATQPAIRQFGPKQRAAGRLTQKSFKAAREKNAAQFGAAVLIPGSAAALDDVQDIPEAEYQDRDHQNHHKERDRLLAHHCL